MSADQCRGCGVVNPIVGLCEMCADSAVPASAVAKLRADLAAARAENAALVEAVRFYADRDNWRAAFPGHITTLIFDDGDRARAALAKARP